MYRKSTSALRDVRQNSKTLPDWPGIGQFLDIAMLKYDATLRKEGRTPAQTLLSLNKLRRHIFIYFLWIFNRIFDYKFPYMSIGFQHIP